jgi:hypothetical protein
MALKKLVRNRTNLLFAGILIFLVLLFLFLLFSKLNRTQQDSGIETRKAGEEMNPSLLKALNENDAQYCNSFSEAEKQDCLSRVGINNAVVTGDISKCSLVAGKEKECEVTFIINQAIAENNPDKCNSLSTIDESSISFCKEMVSLAYQQASQSTINEEGGEE